MLAQERRRPGCVELPDGKLFTLVKPVINPEQMNSGVQVYTQLGRYTVRDRALQLLCEQVC
jgi:hypothetical protein